MITYAPQRVTVGTDGPDGPTKSLLRFLTCGSVDDGKSTLIGRLLYDTKLILEDQLVTLERDSRKHARSRLGPFIGITALGQMTISIDYRDGLMKFSYNPNRGFQFQRESQ